MLEQVSTEWATLGARNVRINLEIDLRVLLRLIRLCHESAAGHCPHQRFHIAKRRTQSLRIDSNAPEHHRRLAPRHRQPRTMGRERLLDQMPPQRRRSLAIGPAHAAIDSSVSLAN